MMIQREVGDLFSLDGIGELLAQLLGNHGLHCTLANHLRRRRTSKARDDRDECKSSDKTFHGHSPFRANSFVARRASLKPTPEHIRFCRASTAKTCSFRVVCEGKTPEDDDEMPQ